MARNKGRKKGRRLGESRTSDCNMDFSCKMQHPLKKICIKLSGSRKGRLFHKGRETGRQAQ